jgi:uncharacterized iron-regulated membrane protein
MRSTLRKLHRWISLTAAAFWLLQALTGVFLVFHWEIDDALVAGPERALDTDRLDAGLQAFVDDSTGRAVAAIWATAGSPGRYEVTVSDAHLGSSTTLRVDGHGTVLRQRSSDTRWANGGWVKQVVSFHQNLLAGEIGSWIVGASGILLLTNIVLALKLAWPARGQWRQTLLPRRTRGTPATLYAWHRALGLWVAGLALVTIACGTMLVFEDGVARWVSAPAIEPSETEITASPTIVTPGRAIGVALNRFPDAEFAGLYAPSTEAPWYRVRVLQPGENRRVFGTTTVFVSGGSGRVLGTHDALSATPARRFMDSLFPIHTGEIAGLAGRVTILLIGCWLATMLALGISLWWARRK